MPHALDRLRLAVALTHTVPGAQLDLACHSGQVVRVGPGPGVDLDACAMRQVVLAAGPPGGPDPSELVTNLRVHGALADAGGGVYRTVAGGQEQRWLATLLAPRRVLELLAGCCAGDLPADAVHGCLKPDLQLGVTCVRMTANDPRHEPRLDEVAAAAAATCLVEELLGELEPVRPPDDGRR